MKARNKGDILSERERELEAEMRFVDDEIERVVKENQKFETAIAVLREAEMQRSLLGKDDGTQTTIEDDSALLFQTNYMQLYRVFGSHEMLWQLFHDEIIKYPEYVTFLELYQISAVSEDSTVNGKTGVTDNRKLISLKIEPESEAKRLRPSVVRTGGTNLSLQNAMFERRAELFEFTDKGTFAKEMDRRPFTSQYCTNVDVEMMIGYLQAQNKTFIDSLMNRNAKAVYKSQKFENVLSSIKNSDRSDVWRKLIGNKLKITPELYFSLKALSERNFPPQIERTITEDLKRVLRYYLKSWDLKVVQREYQQFSQYEKVKNLQSESTAKPPFENFVWERTDHLRIFENLREMCRCFQVFRGDVGYVQGMCRISFFFFSVFQNTIEAFTFMANFLLTKEPMLDCYKFSQPKMELYENAVRKFLPRAAPQCSKALLRENDRLLSVFMMENLFTLFSNYFEEVDAK